MGSEEEEIATTAALLHASKQAKRKGSLLIIEGLVLLYGLQK